MNNNYWNSMIYLAGIVIAVLLICLILFCRKKKFTQENPMVGIVADHNWLKPACKSCPYFVQGGDSKNKDEFLRKGPTRCIRPILDNCLADDSIMIQRKENKKWL